MSGNNTQPIIDPLSDELLADSEVCELLDITRVTLWRYRHEGKRGVRMPYLPLGKRNVTTRAAVQWFYEQVQRQS